MSENISAGPGRPGAAPHDPDQLRAHFERWLRRRQPGAGVAEATVASFETDVAGQAAPVTVVVEAGWDGHPHRLVVRLAPGPHTGALFPHYDMRWHFLTLQRLRTQIHRPSVPRALWYEPDPNAIGAAFLVLDHVGGRTPAGPRCPGPDPAPYNVSSWLTQASAAQRRHLQRATIEQLARVHAAAAVDFAFLDRRRPGETALAAHVRHTREYYEWACQDGPGVPPIERGLEWLHEHWPAESDPVLCWGDARIGNIAYCDFDPLALLDFEMACLGPRELDLGWMIFLHRVFEDRVGAPAGGLPDLLRRADVVEDYADVTGYRASDLDFYTTYAALQHAIITTRIQLRAGAFGSAEFPQLAAMLDGTYWKSLDTAMTGGS